MRALMTGLALAATVGSCSRSPQSVNVQVIQSSTDSGITTVAPPSQPDAVRVYSEKTEVERLLYRASELRQKGQFESALAHVDQALGIDPNSPSAAAMKIQLEEIIKRI
jgi:hypothetical protein